MSEGNNNSKSAIRDAQEPRSKIVDAADGFVFDVVIEILLLIICSLFSV